MAYKSPQQTIVGTSYELTRSYALQEEQFSYNFQKNKSETTIQVE
jgi:hypothetical protein